MFKNYTVYPCEILKKYLSDLEITQSEFSKKKRESAKTL